MLLAARDRKGSRSRPAVPAYCRCTPGVAVPYDEPAVMPRKELAALHPPAEQAEAKPGEVTTEA